MIINNINKYKGALAAEACGSLSLFVAWWDITTYDMRNLSA